MWKAAARFSHLGLFLGIAVVLGLLGGGWLDRRFATGHVFTLLGILVGLVAGFRELYRAARTFQRSAAHRTPTDPVQDAAAADAVPRPDDDGRGAP